MNIMAVFVLAFIVVAAGCSHKEKKHVYVPVPSCFSEGDDQTKYCKAQRVTEDGKIAITRCIGSLSKTAAASLRGKCVEKICAPDSGNDCELKGEIAVLDEYAQLVRDQAFNDEESGSDVKSSAIKKVSSKPSTAAKVTSSKSKSKKSKGKKLASVEPEVPKEMEKEKEIDVDPLAKLPPEPVKAEPAPAPVVKKAPASTEAVSAEPPPMEVVLKPSKPSKKPTGRDPASVKGSPDFKKVCVSKDDVSAPEILRGKCATRSCVGLTCTYQGRKEMFEWAAR